MNDPHVLVVDDHGPTLVLLRRIFERRGWRVSTASTLASALDELDFTPDCLLLDLHLPDGRGEDLLEEIRARGLETEVVVTTADARPDRLEALADFAPDAVMLKPVNLGELLAACAPAADRAARRGRPSRSNYSLPVSVSPV